MAEFLITATMPDAAVESFLQVLRQWDGGQSDRHLDIVGKGDTLTQAEVEQVLQRLSPEMPLLYVQTMQAFQDQHQPPQGVQTQWLAEMGYATYERLMNAAAVSVFGRVPSWDVLPAAQQHAWLAAAAAIRRRVVQWGLSAAEESNDA